MKYVVRLQDRPDPKRMGGKAAHLAQLVERDFLIPQGFVVTPAAFMDSLTRYQGETLRDWQQHDNIEVRELQNLLATLQLGERVQSEILQTLAEMFPYGGQFAVRSSAVEEDQTQQSLAGQLSTFLTVKPEDLYDKIAQVWRSAYRETVMIYRQRQGLPPLPEPPAVLVQQMLEPSVAGVAFGADPVTGRRNIRLISAVYGLGTTLVSGESDADTFYLDNRNQIVQRQIARKVKAACANPLSDSGVSVETLDDRRRFESTLTDTQILDIGQLVRRAGRELGAPQDIEWAIAQTGQLYLLQSRPITALPSAPEPTGLQQIWDNSNIAESYSGVTTPLTFSFARRAYTEVYRQFCAVMGIPRQEIQQRDRVFANMIGLLQGRIYYNLLNWYRVLAMLPGFRLNRQFMEQMMGVKEPLPETIVAEIETKSRWQDGWNLGRSLLSLGLNLITLPLRIWSFTRHLKKVLSQQQDLSYLRIDELANYYRDIEQQLLPQWRAPIINDFFAMIFYGVLRKLTAGWCDDVDGAIANTLVQQAGQMISIQPARQIQAMAQLIQDNPALIETLSQGTLSEIQATLKYHSELAQRYDAYLMQFSDRCLDELKLESPTLADNPLPLLRSISLVARSQDSRPAHNTPLPHFKRRLRSLGIKRVLLGLVVYNARRRLRDRENLRFERTRVFGLARKIFLEMGKRLFALDAIVQPRDIFSLDIAEILSFTEGTSTCTDLKSLVALRQAEFERYRQATPLPSRFCTYGVPYLYPGQTASPSSMPDASSRQGLGCSTGVVRGRVKVIRDPQQALADPEGIPTGAILVAERTDPGWILLFPAAAGLLVERGSLLSHAAIVSRELGLPAIVSIPGVMTWLEDGDWVELDGGTGRVEKIEPRL
ncbi:MAG: phosphoenolpyruvate synthase [Spirulina sp. SIO3F2]|nr:phosphoenolpyruvate synthase [Spirulina sp. SIO3F2]